MGAKFRKLFERSARKVAAAATFSVAVATCGQQVYLSKVTQSHEGSTDKELSFLSAEVPQSEYLGELEVTDAGQDTQEAFSKIYKKAKQIGANYCVPQSNALETGEVSASHFFLTLYYIDRPQIPQEQNTVYFFSLGRKDQKISLNGVRMVLSPGTYQQVTLKPGQPLFAITPGLLGSSVKLQYSEGQPSHYFAVSGAGISQNPDGTPGLRLKSGDIFGIESSYAQFLLKIFKKIPNNF